MSFGERWDERCEITQGRGGVKDVGLLLKGRGEDEKT